MDEPLPSTPAGDTIHEETDDFIESNPKDGNVVLTQPATDAPVTSLVLSTGPVNVKDPVAGEKTDGNSPIPPAS